MKGLSLLLFAVFTVFCSCSKAPSDYRTSGYPTVIIKGYMARDNMGQDLGYIGNPDINTEYPADSKQSDLGLACFPNPAKDIMIAFVYAKIPGEKMRIWMVPAALSGDFPGNGAIIGNMIPVQGSKPLIDTTLTTSGENVSTKFLFKNIPSGYYRVYYKCNGILLWDNIVFTNNTGNP